MVPQLVAQYYYHPMMDGTDWGWGIGMMIFWFVILAGLVVFAVYALRNHNGASTPAGKDPLDIARERLAKGEINHEEFEQIKTVLAKK